MSNKKVPDEIYDNVIEFYKGSKTVTVTFSADKYKTRIIKLAKDRPEDVEIVTSDENYVCAHIPASWIKINPSRKMSESRKKELSDRMGKVRSKKKVV